MGKLCAKGKAAAKRKFDVYPSAYANMYASAVCSGKVTPGGKKNKKASGGEIQKFSNGGHATSQKRKKVSDKRQTKGNKIIAAGCGAVTRRKTTTLS